MDMKKPAEAGFSYITLSQGVVVPEHMPIDHILSDDQAEAFKTRLGRFARRMARIS